MKRGVSISGLGTLALAALVATSLSACREAEQNRPLALEPGVYKGKQDEKLSEETREQLRERTQLQGRRGY